jgi:hypothetical protein
MTAPAWDAAWLGTAADTRRELWRGVEAQHQVATMRLVDDLHEQELLERVLDASKPPLPPAWRNLPYLLATPFRYASPWNSRFRSADEPGAWYGADDTQTVAAELAYWRWRFFIDSDGLRDEQLVTEHTFFRATFSGREIDLTVPPWDSSRASWRDPDSYGACQTLARAVRRTKPPAAGSIRYESARRESGFCQVVFDPACLHIDHPDEQQTWVCKTTRQKVLLVHGQDRLEFGPMEARAEGSGA